jgi:hypothetical protein
MEKQTIDQWTDRISPESTVMQILHMIVAILTLCYLVHVQVLDGTVQIRFLRTDRLMKAD